MTLCVGLSLLALNLLYADTVSSPPHIIFVLVDDLGYGETGFNGQEKVQTPFLDKLAAQGAVFTNFYSGAPVCAPSRATFLYGQHTGHAPIRGNPIWTASGKLLAMPKGQPTLPTELKRAGYTNAVIGKWGMNEEKIAESDSHPFQQGFDKFFGFNTHREAHYHWPDYIWDGLERVSYSGGKKKGNWKERRAFADDQFTDKAVTFIQDRGQTPEKPFFLYFNPITPHKGYTVPEESKRPYLDLGWPQRSPKGAGMRHYEADDELHTTYAGMISRMDRNVGRVWEAVEAAGLAENTLFIFTSDNGDHYQSDFFASNGPLSGMKGSIREGGIRVPTFMVWKGRTPAGSRVEQPFAFWDFLPTLTEIAGIETLAETDGVSLVPTLTGRLDEQPQHDYLYWEHIKEGGPEQAVRQGNWKAIRAWDASEKGFGPVQLYDLEKDPSESNDLSKIKPEKAEALKALFLTARSEHPEWPLDGRTRADVKERRRAEKKMKQGKR